MILRVGLCEESDMQRVFAIVSDSFGPDDPFIEAMLPKHSTPAGRVVGGERFLNTFKSDPVCRFVKATDTETGRIVGMAKYLVFEPGVQQLNHDMEGDYWADEDAKAYAQHLESELSRLRLEAVKSANGPLISLEILAVEPQSQGRGAGSMLVKWGTDLADSMGAEAVVEGSDAGKPLYEKHGYTSLQRVTMQVPEKWSDEPETSFWWMRRGIGGKKWMG